MERGLPEKPAKTMMQVDVEQQGRSRFRRHYQRLRKFELLASLLADGEVRIGPMTIKNNQRPTIGTKVLKKP
jgi:hypothetical protein